VLAAGNNVLSHKRCGIAMVMFPLKLQRWRSYLRRSKLSRNAEEDVLICSIGLTVGNIIPRSPDKVLLHEHRVTEGGLSRAN